MQAIRNAGYRTSLFGKTHLHPHQGDLREKEDLLHAYGLDDVDEIGGPHTSRKVLSHMTARWQKKGIWELYKTTFPAKNTEHLPVASPSQLPLEEYADVYVGQQAKHYLEQYHRTQPWFCWVSFGGPHEPWDAPEPYASMYKPEDMPSPIKRAPDTRKRPQGYLDGLWRKQANFRDADFAPLRANYAGNVTLIDDQIGEILSVVEARGELDNTVIVLTTDHGEMNGDQGLLYKTNFLNSASHIPLIIATPETASSEVRGSWSSTPVELFDVGPTLTELAGGELQHPNYARSLCPVLANPALSHRSEAIVEIFGEIMLYDGCWKFAVNKDGEGYLLFNLQEDPNEQHNLVGMSEVSEVEGRLRARLMERIVGSLHPGDFANGTARANQLEAIALSDRTAEVV